MVPITRRKASNDVHTNLNVYHPNRREQRCVPRALFTLIASPFLLFLSLHVSHALSLSLSHRSSRVSEPTKLPGKIVATSRTAQQTGLSRAPKGLISAIITAYNTHCALVVSPDDVWLTILSQFCAYVNKNAEGLRDRVVEHEGQKKLTVEGYGSLETADYVTLIKDLLGKIRQNIKSPELADWFRPGFSTTTETDEVCAAATAMASLQAYFEYGMCLSCGIPSVTLMGTVEDWKLLREKIERLLEFEVRGNPEGNVMELWVGYLRKVCDGFVESAEHPDSAATVDFWDKVCVHFHTVRWMTQQFTLAWRNVVYCCRWICRNNINCLVSPTVPSSALQETLDKMG